MGFPLQDCESKLKDSKMIPLAVTLEKHALLDNSSESMTLNSPNPPAREDDPSLSEDHVKIVSKIDWHLLPFLWILYLFSILERVNIGNARIMNFEDGQGQMERELGMTPDQYNWAVSIFYVGYILLEVPSNMMLQKYPPSRWLSLIVILIGLSATGMALSRSSTQMLIARLFLGCTQAGLVPGILVYLSSWYRREELGARMGIFFSAASFSTAIGGLVAYGVAQWPSDGLLSPWQALFLLEGCPYILLGFLTLWILPDSPLSAPFLNAEEKKRYVQSLPNQSSASDSDSLERRKKSHSLSAFVNPRVWCLMFIFIGLVTPATGLAVFLGTLVKALGFESLQAQSLTFPPSFFAGIACIAASKSSDYFSDRFWHLVTGALIACMSLMALNGVNDTGLWYALIICAMMGIAASIPILMTWSSEFFSDSQERAVGTALMVSFGNLGGAISGQVYRQEDAPLYRTGHWIMVGSLMWSVIWACLLRLVWSNGRPLSSQIPSSP